MEKIKSLDLHRTSIAKIFDTTNEFLTKDNPDMNQVSSNMKVIEKKLETLTQLDQKYLDMLLDQDSEDIDLDSEMAIIDEHLCKFSALKMQVEMQIHSSTVEDSLHKSIPGTSSCCTPNCYKSQLKYPQMEFRKFGGDIRDWLSFWSQFRRYHEDNRLPNGEKLQLLIQATIPKSRARQIIESYPPVGDNYPKVIECLTRRFGRQDLQIEVYVRELLKLVLGNVNKSTKLNTLYDQIEAQLRSLETLGVKSDTCSAMLFPLVESCLPEDLLRIWERSTTFNDDDSSKVRLDQLMNFLRKEVESEERVALAISGFGDKFRRKEFLKDVPTATGLLTNDARKVRCLFCQQSHYSSDCDEAKKKSPVELKKILSEKGRCHTCLKFGHIAVKCKTAAKLTCQSCKGKHVTLMCPKSAKPSTDENSPTESLCNTSSNRNYYEGFLQTLVVNIKGKDATRSIRAIIDTGSHRSYITSGAAKEMGYEVLRKEELIHALFGGLSSEVTPHNCYRVFLENYDKSYSCQFEALDQSIICTNVLGIRNGPWMKELQDINIKVNDKSQAPIEILIGADIAGKLFCGEQHVLKCGLVAMKTKLGWTLMGKVSTPPPNIGKPCNMIALSLLSTTAKLTDLWTLDVLGIENTDELKSKKEHEQEILNNFQKIVTRNPDGRYEVSMPWIQGHKPLPDNFQIAKKRLDNLMNKLAKDGYYNEYDQVFKEWLQEGIIEEVNDTNYCGTTTHYLPHRHVVKLSSTTTKLRPVFDASARGKDGPSLNQCLEKGINLLTLIPSLLINFRKSKIGVIADIRKAFLQISLHKSDRDFLRFLWYNKDRQLIVYRHVRVVFGVTCSPFLLNAVIKHHLNNIIQEQRENLQEDTILTKLMNSFYVDHCVTSLDTEEELQKFIQESTEIFAEAQFDLRLWEFTLSDPTYEENCLSSVLGMTWDRNNDTLHLCLDNLRQIDTNIVTKKLILSVANRIFDPLGFVSPVLLLPKLLLQKTWMIQLNWTTEVPEDIKESFLRWLNGLNCLSSISIPRWFFTQIPQDGQLSIHTFADASKEAYAVAIFVRCETTAGISLQLVQAKSRVSPTKKISIPRLELLAATIAARLSLQSRKPSTEILEPISGLILLQSSLG